MENEFALEQPVSEDISAEAEASELPAEENPVSAETALGDTVADNEVPEDFSVEDDIIEDAASDEAEEAVPDEAGEAVTEETIPDESEEAVPEETTPDESEEAEPDEAGEAASPCAVPAASSAESLYDDSDKGVSVATTVLGILLALFVVISALLGYRLYQINEASELNAYEMQRTIASQSDAIDEKDARIAELEAQVAALNAKVDEQGDTIAELEEQITSQSDIIAGQVEYINAVQELMLQMIIDAKDAKAARMIIDKIDSGEMLFADPEDAKARMNEVIAMQGVEYVVVPFDTLEFICRKNRIVYCDENVALIMSVNGMTDRNKLTVGQVLLLPLAELITF